MIFIRVGESRVLLPPAIFPLGAFSLKLIVKRWVRIKKETETFWFANISFACDVRFYLELGRNIFLERIEQAESRLEDKSHVSIHVRLFMCIFIYGDVDKNNIGIRNMSLTIKITPIGVYS